MFCNAFHSFSRLFERVPSPKQSNVDVVPPNHLVLELVSSPPALLSIWRRPLSLHRVDLAISVTRSMQDDMQDCKE